MEHGAWRQMEIVAAAKRQWRRLDFYSFAAYFNYYTFSSILFSKQKQISLSLSYTLLTLELSPRARHHRSLLTLWLTFHYILNPGLGREVVNAALLHFLAAKNTVEHDTRYSSQLQFFSTRYTLAILKASRLAFLF